MREGKERGEEVMEDEEEGRGSSWYGMKESFSGKEGKLFHDE